jgi:pimeloyl-ACP methyl ester carboxylesterase
MDLFDIAVGAYWPDAVDEGLTSSDHVVGILSPDAVASRNVKNEWDWALANGKPLLLLQIKPCSIPHRYVSLNFIEVAGPDLAAPLAALLDALGVALAEPLDLAQPETQYARNGAISIAFQVLGSGPPDLVFTGGFVSNLEYNWEYPTSAHFMRGLAEFARLIVLDKRGTGLSDRVDVLPPLPDTVDDIRAVMDAAGSSQAVLLGIGEGGAMSILFATRYPERTAALILYGAYAKGTQAPDYAGGWPTERHEEFASMVEQHWGSEAYIRWAAPRAAEDPSLCAWLTRFLRNSASPSAAMAMARFGAAIDVRHALEAIAAPTLIVHQPNDPVSALVDDRYLAQHIAGARLVELPQATREGILGDHTPMLASIRSFVSLATSNQLRGSGGSD